MESVVLIQEAAHLLRQGGVVAFPTETVYGLGASVFNPAAIARLFTLKKRPSDNPLIVHLSTLDQLPMVAETPSPLFFALAHHFWPGPLTLLVRKKPCVPDIVSAGLSTIGVRIPAHPLARALIRAVGVPLVAPSANLSGRPSSTEAAHVRTDFPDDALFVLDGGPCMEGLESTVLQLEPSPLILRPGGVSQEALSTFLGTPVLQSTGKSQKALCPGVKYRHYAPRGEIHLCETDEALEELRAHFAKERVFIVRDLEPVHFYAKLREADRAEAAHILLQPSKGALLNAAFRDRLTRASTSVGD